MNTIYEPTLSKRDFMLALLKADEKVQPRDVESYWKKKKLVENVDRDVTRKPASKYYEELTAEQLEALNDGYYRELRGSTGARGFWEWSRGGVPRRTSITGFVFGEHWRQLLSLALTRGQASLVLGAVAAGRKASAEWSPTDCQPCVDLS